MKPFDAAAIHWFGGTGMFALLRGEILVGVVIVVIAQFIYNTFTGRG